MRSDGDMEGITIDTITPAVSQEELFGHRRCYMGISLDNPVFQNDFLWALLEWATGHFDHCLIVVGDYLRRFNETMLNGLEGIRAEQAAEAVGDQFLQREGDLLSRFSSDKMTVIRWKPCLESDEYARARNTLAHLYNANEKFRAAVQRDAHSFVKRQQKHNQSFAVDEVEAIHLSSQYLLEEIAVFSALSEKGWTVELYPGPELDVLVDVARGLYDGIPVGLRKRINVELRGYREKG
ncbi:MAG: tRNA-dependent cyclodipeptide synthase [Sedimentisphaerales bacterium]|nr:tRNA-dependent cyclodipeptide synthase [Sedimentisphaerales bacterium]